ncbi:MAG: Crp/Fnr family transcriptional regulator [Anaerocolumna sp.]
MTVKEAFTFVKILENIKPTTLNALQTHAKLIKVQKDEHLFFDKEEVNTVYIVIEGMVSIYKVSNEGEKKVIYVLGKGLMVNEVILQNLPASANCEVLSTAFILCIPKDKLLSIMEQDFTLTKAILDSMALKIRRLYRQLKNTSGSIRLDKKIAAKLWKLASDYGVPTKEGTSIEMDLTVTYLADLVGAKRESVSRHLKVLTNLNLVIFHKNRFIIPDPKKLMEYFKLP